ncbi:uncharacterized protein LOC143740185 [Siphateles boraxobius]|uniref:uncharacterized protein LOC143740185 n=1 Tax=Siphateles boraxobius TaxID=180520 RepID=UPI004063AE48
MRGQDQGESTTEQERDVVVVGHEREEVQGDDRGEVQGERPGTATTTGRHRRSGWDPIWVDISRFKPWLYHVQSHGIFCRLCRQHKKAPKRGVGKRPFIEIGCQLYQVDYLDKHLNTQHHQESVKSHSSLIQGTNSVLVAFEPVVVLEHEAVIGGFKCLYHTIKRKQPHHTNYPALLEFAEILGCDYFKKLKFEMATGLLST